MSEETSLLSNSDTDFGKDHVSEASRCSSWYKRYLIQIISSIRSNWVLLTTSFLLLSSSILNSYYFKQMTNYMPNYAWFLSQLSTVVYVPVFFGIVYMNRGLITKDMTDFPKMSFFLIGALDAFSGILSMIGGVHTTGSMQALLSNAIVPFVLFFSYIWLKQRFSFSQIFGAFVIMIGVVVSMLPTFLSSNEESSSTSGSSLIFMMLFLFNNIPSALSSVYKDQTFNDLDMNVNYLQAWVALWQLLFGFVLIPINTLSILGPDKIEYGDMLSVMYSGAKCLFLRTNTIVAPKCRWPMSFPVPSSYPLISAISSSMIDTLPGPSGSLNSGDITTSLTESVISSVAASVTSPWSPSEQSFIDHFHSLSASSQNSLLLSLPLCDTCSHAWIPVFLYLGINMFYNYIMIVVIQQSGSSWLYVLMTMRLPLIQLVFSLPQFNYPPDSFGIPELLGLVFILGGLSWYKYGSPEDDEGSDSTDLQDVASLEDGGVGVGVGSGGKKTTGNILTSVMRGAGGISIPHHTYSQQNDRYWSLKNQRKTGTQQRALYYSKLHNTNTPVMKNSNILHEPRNYRTFDSNHMSEPDNSVLVMSNRKIPNNSSGISEHNLKSGISLKSGNSSDLFHSSNSNIFGNLNTLDLYSKSPTPKATSSRAAGSPSLFSVGGGVGGGVGVGVGGSTPSSRSSQLSLRPSTPLSRPSTPLSRRAIPLSRPSTPLSRRATPKPSTHIHQPLLSLSYDSDGSEGVLDAEDLNTSLHDFSLGDSLLNTVEHHNVPDNATSSTNTIANLTLSPISTFDVPHTQIGSNNSQISKFPNSPRLHHSPALSSLSNNGNKSKSGVFPIVRPGYPVYSTPRTPSASQKMNTPKLGSANIATISSNVDSGAPVLTRTYSSSSFTSVRSTHSPSFSSNPTTNNPKFSVPMASLQHQHQHTLEDSDYDLPSSHTLSTKLPSSRAKSSRSLVDMVSDDHNDSSILNPDVALSFLHLNTNGAPALSDLPHSHFNSSTIGLSPATSSRTSISTPVSSSNHTPASPFRSPYSLSNSSSLNKTDINTFSSRLMGYGMGSGMNQSMRNTSPSAPSTSPIPTLSTSTPTSSFTPSPSSYPLHSTSSLMSSHITQPSISHSTIASSNIPSPSPLSPLSITPSPLTTQTSPLTTHIPTSQLTPTPTPTPTQVDTSNTTQVPLEESSPLTDIVLPLTHLTTEGDSPTSSNVKLTEEIPSLNPVETDIPSISSNSTLPKKNKTKTKTKKNKRR